LTADAAVNATRMEILLLYNQLVLKLKY